MARKGMYEDYLTEDGLLLLEGWARDGITDKDIAEKHIGVNESTLCRWKNDHPKILQALKKGRAPIVEKIENSLYDMCQKQTYKDVVEEITTDGNGNVISRHKKIVTKEVPPNPTAIIFALKNLKPGKWRDKQVIEANAEGQLAQLIDGLKEPEKDKKDGK